MKKTFLQIGVVLFALLSLSSCVVPYQGGGGYCPQPVHYSGGGYQRPPQMMMPHHASNHQRSPQYQNHPLQGGYGGGYQPRTIPFGNPNGSYQAFPNGRMEYNPNFYPDMRGGIYMPRR